jgi:uncharacterized membrane protein YoaK (UPF0700 family)
MEWSGMRNRLTFSKEKVRKIIRYAILSLPLAGVAFASVLTLSVRAHQFLILITLVWFQFFLLFEVFKPGK